MLLEISIISWLEKEYVARDFTHTLIRGKYCYWKFQK